MSKVLLLDTDIARITQDDCDSLTIEVKPVYLNVDPDGFADNQVYLDYLGWYMRERIDTLAQLIQTQFRDDWSKAYEQICQEKGED